MTNNDMQASRQWAERPNDERFWNLDDLFSTLTKMRTHSMQTSLPVSKVKVTPFMEPGLDSPDLGVSRTNNRVFRLTHWSFGQLAKYADAPAEYLRRLKPETAASCINEGLDRYHGEDVQMLLHKNDDSGNDATLRAMTTNQYSRLWNSEVVKSLLPAKEHGWMTPPARPANGDDPRARPATVADIVPGQGNFGLQVRPGDIIAPAGVYHGPQDMFIFQVNPNRVIDIDGDALMRGFYLENSEVGAKAFKLTCFYLESVCGNHIVWGAKNMKTVRVVHKGNNFGGGKFMHQLNRNLHELSNMNTTAERGMVHAARNHVIGETKEQVVEVLFGNKVVALSKATIEKGYDTAQQWEHTAKAPPNTTWGMVHGLTRYSQSIPYADKRADIDAAGGRMLQIAYKVKEGLLPVRA